MWDLDYKESWVPKNWCFWAVVLEKTLDSPLDCKEIQPVHSKGNQSWIFTERADAEAETPIFWPPDEKNGLILKDPDAGKDWRQEEKGTTEDEMVGWHQHPTFWGWVWISSGSWRLTGKPGMLQFIGPKELDMTERLNWTEPTNNQKLLLTKYSLNFELSKFLNIVRSYPLNSLNILFSPYLIFGVLCLVIISKCKLYILA